MAMLSIIAIFLGSFLIVCTKQASMMDGSMYAQGSMTNDMMADCMQKNTGCEVSLAEHMKPFSQAHPFSETNILNTLLMLTFVVCFWIFQNYLLDHERFRQKLRSHLHALAQSFTPPFLIFAFSKGILHSKIYA